MRRSSFPRIRLAGGAAVLAAAALLVAGASTASATPSGRGTGFVFHAPAVKGAPTGELRLNGIGAFNATSGSTRAAGTFRCTSAVNQGPLAGCLAGQGVRWSAAALLPSAPFKCTGAATEALKAATTDRDTVVLHSQFFRAGDYTRRSPPTCSCRRATSRRTWPACRTSGCRAWAATPPSPTSSAEPRRRHTPTAHPNLGGPAATAQSGPCG